MRALDSNSIPPMRARQNGSVNNESLDSNSIPPMRARQNGSVNNENLGH